MATCRRRRLDCLPRLTASVLITQACLSLALDVTEQAPAWGAPAPPDTPSLRAMPEGDLDPSSMLVCADRPGQPVTYGKIRLPSLKVEVSFRSKRPRSSLDTTIITQCSVDRLHMLEAQCASWGGIISAAVYWPLLHFSPDAEQGLDEAVATLTAFHERIDAAGSDAGKPMCRLDVALVSETIKAAEMWAYPYNSLRNQALSRATTDVVLLLDVDFIVSRGLHESLSRPETHAARVEETCTRRSAIVVPAFETDPSAGVAAGSVHAVRAQTADKEALSAMFTARNVIQFAEFYPAGHKATAYKKWFTVDQPYPVKFKVGYEPYVLVSRKFMPWYDERFRGYGWDKVMHIYQLDALGFAFVVHPGAWVVHRPHAPSSGYNHTFTGEAYTTRHKPTDHLFKMERIAKDIMAELRAGTYPRDGVTSLAHCRQAQRVPVDQKQGVWW